jgi:hypothetical protein
MKHGMPLGDHLDLEWFLEKDRADDPLKTLERDRGLGLQALAAAVPVEGFGAYWLARRRATEADALPSRRLGRFLLLCRWVLACLGALAGVSLVRGLLLYSGSEPVNVSVFFLLAIFPQSLLCLVSAALLAFRRRDGLRIPLRPVFELALLRPGRFSAQSGFVRALLLGRGQPARLLAWDCVRALHLGGLCFAAGSLVAFLASVAVTDLAFGWQSTLRAGAEGVGALVSLLALPWSWLPSQWGLVPNLAQIEGSRIVLKDGIAALTSADLAAWWPFLAMCLLLYALLPRLVLLGLAHSCLRRQEGRGVHPDLARIADRMRSPLVGGGEGAEAGHAPLPVETRRGGSERRPVEAGEAAAPAGCVLILPPELWGRVGEEALSGLTLRVFGYPPARVVPAELEETEAGRVLEECSGLAWAGGHQRFAVLVEAWQPPIHESLRALKRLGEEGGDNRSLVLILAGRPAAGNWLTMPAQADLEAWAEALGRLRPLRIDMYGAAS